MPDGVVPQGAGEAVLARLGGAETLVVPDTGHEAPDLAGALGAGAVLAARLPGREEGDEPLGALVALYGAPRPLGAGEAATMQALARLAGLAVNNARTRSALSEALAAARDRAETDELTGMPNRRALSSRLRAAAATARRTRRPLAALAIDLDGFKAVNDAGGHAAGDAMLRRVGQALLGSVRPGDTAARLGGDEFVVLLPETSVDEATRVAARLRAAIGAHTHDGRPLTASMGVAVLAPDWASGDLLVAADEASYEAKRLGGDRLAVAAGPPAPA